MHRRGRSAPSSQCRFRQVPSNIGCETSSTFFCSGTWRILRFRWRRINDSTLMQATNSDNPVLNNPYEEPKYYYDTVRGNLDYNKVLKGRRPYMGNIDITPSSTRTEGEFFSDSDFSDSTILGERILMRFWMICVNYGAYMMKTTIIHQTMKALQPQAFGSWRCNICGW